MAQWLKKLIEKKTKKDEAVCSAVVAAAGSSARMKGTNKLLADIDGMPVLVHTLTALNRCRKISEIIVVTREADLSTVAAMCSTYNISKLTKIVIGGKTRLESVYNGVMQVSPKAKLIAVHDGARPFVTEEIVSETVEAAMKFNAAAPAVPVTSTIKLAEKGFVKRTIDRECLYEIQTPQIFTAELLKGALQNAVDKALYITDDCMAVEAIGGRVKLTEGSRENIKLTTAVDLEYAEAILSARRNKK